MTEYVPRGYQIVLQPVRKDGPTLMITCVDGRPPDVQYAGTHIKPDGESPLCKHIIKHIASLASDFSSQFPDYDPD